MRTFMLASAFVALGFAGAARMQTPQQPDAIPTESRERLRQLAADPAVQDVIRGLQALQEAERLRRQSDMCAGPGNSSVALNEEIFFDGRAYRCVEVFGPNEAPGMANGPLKRRSLGFIRAKD